MTPKPGCTVKEGTEIILHTGEVKNENNMVVVPSIIGSSSESASKILSTLGLNVKFTGSGIVTDQSLEGKVVKKGTTITADLDIMAD